MPEPSPDLFQAKAIECVKLLKLEDAIVALDIFTIQYPLRKDKVLLSILTFLP
jgi:hypothetical protein